MKLTAQQLQQIIREEMVSEMAAGRMAPSLTVTKLARVSKSVELAATEMAGIQNEDGFRMLDPDLQDRARSAYIALSDMRTTLNALTEAMNAAVRRPRGM